MGFCLGVRERAHETKNGKKCTYSHVFILALSPPLFDESNGSN